MSYEQNNITKINRGFTVLADAMSRIISEGMERVGERSLDFLLRGHEVKHDGVAWRHPSESDTLGYAVIHDGEIVRAVSHEGGDIQPWGDIMQVLHQVASEYPKGWVTIVASDMANDWYRVDWEIDFLNYAADGVILNADEFFKKQ